MSGPSLLLAWVLCPLLLLALAVGCGLLVERLGGERLPGALLPAAGIALIIVVGQFLTLSDSTAELAVPAIAILAAAGLALGLPGRGSPAPWAIAAAAGVFAVYAAPVVLSGEATIAGFIKLDDTATWLALTDRVMEHGRSLDGLAPSSYEATLDFNLDAGYPIGVFLPLGVAGGLTGADIAWLVQPYMAFLAVLLSLGLWELTGPLVRSPRLRAAAAFVAAQPALLYGYYLWGGIKEMAAAALVATAVALVPGAARGSPRRVASLALVSAALLGVLSGGGLVWLVPALLAGLWAAVRWLGLRRALARALAFTGGVVVLAVPVFAAGGLEPPTSSPLTSDDAIGNLLGPVRIEQVAGIWPAGDFRLPADAPLLTGSLVGIAIGAAAVGLVAAWRQRALAPLAFVAGSLLACAGILAFGSPWVDAKALATASAALPFAACLGAAALWAAGRRGAGAVLLAAVAGGVLWSNALAYREVNLAPAGQLAELRDIGDRIAGEGPALMTEYEPYGVRHFLREADPEGVSELRRRAIPLRGGDRVEKGFAADTDDLDPEALLAYRSLVLRRSPLQSRPPYPYELVSTGEFYEVWQRPAMNPGTLRRHLGLGGRFDPAAAADCSRLTRLAEAAGSDRTLAAVRRPSPIVVPGADSGRIGVDVAGDYEIWLGGSVRGETSAYVDGRGVGSVRHQLNNQGQFVRLGSTRLERGAHEVRIEREGADLHPGSGGPRRPDGPLLLTRIEAADTEVDLFDPAEARDLCKRRWDWVAAVEEPR